MLALNDRAAPRRKPTIEQLVQLEARQQAANQVSVSNSIGSLRLLGDELARLRRVAEQRRADAARRSGSSMRMDFSTRDCYRHVVEEIAEPQPAGETEVAREAVALAVRGGGEDGAGASDARRAHVGFTPSAPAAPGSSAPCTPRCRDRPHSRAGRTPTRCRSTRAAASACSRSFSACARGSRSTARSPGRGGPKRCSRSVSCSRAASSRSRSPTGSSRCSSSRSRCRAWTTATALPPSRAPWSSCRPCSAAPSRSKRSPRRSRCASWPTATRSCATGC